MPKDIKERMVRSTDYNRIVEVRAAQHREDESEDEMIIEGRAVVYDEDTLLFSLPIGRDTIEVHEKIDRHALDETDTKDCFLKFNHSDEVLPLARTKNGSLELRNEEDGLYIRAKLPNTQQARDLYTLVKEGIIDKMSFAFTIDKERCEEEEDKENHIVRYYYTVLKIRKLYDVAAVNLPAYDSTDLYARRHGDVEALREKVEADRAEKRLAEAKNEALEFIKSHSSN